MSVLRQAANDIITSVTRLCFHGISRFCRTHCPAKRRKKTAWLIVVALNAVVWRGKSHTRFALSSLLSQPARATVHRIIAASMRVAIGYHPAILCLAVANNARALSWNHAWNTHARTHASLFMLFLSRGPSWITQITPPVGSTARFLAFLTCCKSDHSVFVAITVNFICWIEWSCTAVTTDVLTLAHYTPSCVAARRNWWMQFQIKTSDHRYNRVTIAQYLCAICVYIGVVFSSLSHSSVTHLWSPPTMWIGRGHVWFIYKYRINCWSYWRWCCVSKLPVVLSSVTSSAVAVVLRVITE